MIPIYKPREIKDCCIPKIKSTGWLSPWYRTLPLHKQPMLPPCPYLWQLHGWLSVLFLLLTVCVLHFSGHHGQELREVNGSITWNWWSIRHINQQKNYNYLITLSDIFIISHADSFGLLSQSFMISASGCQTDWILRDRFVHLQIFLYL